MTMTRNILGVKNASLALNAVQVIIEYSVEVDLPKRWSISFLSGKFTICWRDVPIPASDNLSSAATSAKVICCAEYALSLL